MRKPAAAVAVFLEFPVEIALLEVWQAELFGGLLDQLFGDTTEGADDALATVVGRHVGSHGLETASAKQGEEQGGAEVV